MKEFFVGLWRSSGPPAVLVGLIVVLVFVVSAFVMRDGEHHGCVNQCAGAVVAEDTVAAVVARRQHCDDLCKARNK